MKRLKKYSQLALAICLMLGFMSSISATGDTQEVNVVHEVDSFEKIDAETGAPEEEVINPGEVTEDVNAAPEEEESAKEDTEIGAAEDETTISAGDTQDINTTPEENSIKAEEDIIAKMNASTRAIKGDIFTVNGLTYEITYQPASAGGTPNGNCKLKSIDTAVSGLEITIPEGVIWDGVNYYVTNMESNAIKDSAVHTVHIASEWRFSLPTNSLTSESLRYLIFEGEIKTGDFTRNELLPAFREWTQEQGFQNLWWEKYNDEKMRNIKIVFPTYDAYKKEYDASYGSNVRFDGGLYCNYTYNGTLQFHDENGTHLSGLDRPSLIGKFSSIYYVKNGTSWIYDETKILPDVPVNTSGYDAWSPVKGSGYPYKNKSNLGGYYIPPSDGKIYLTKVPEILNDDGSKSKTISRVYDGTQTQLLMKTVGNLSANSNDRFAFKFSAGNPATGKTWNQNLLIPKADISASLVDKNIKTVKNVGDSTTYTAQLENYDKHAYIGFGSTVEEYIPGWTSPVTKSFRASVPLSLTPDVLYNSEASVTVNITPATATMTPQTTTSLIWNSQTTLPNISLTTGSTAGIISWDKDQVPKIGTHEYDYTYVPDNATAINVVTGAQTANYTNPEITGKIAITYTSQVTDVKITPLTPSVGRGNTQQMSAVVEGNGSPSQEVTWSISGNSSTATTISDTGLLSIGEDESVGDSIIVKAVSKEDNTKSATTKVSVLQPTVTSITLAPANPDIIRGGTQRMSVTIEGTNFPSQEVTWSISGNTSTATTISGTGLLSIGQDESVGDSIIVTAVSKEDNTKSATTKVSVLQPTVTSITLTPANPDIIRGGTQQMSATVTGTGFPSQEVTWSISGNTSTATTINGTGLLSIGQDESVGDSIIVKAVSKEDNTKFKTTKVMVLSPTVTSVSVSPVNPDIIRGDTQQMSASVIGTGHPSQEVTWSISGNTSTTTTISKDGLLTIGKDEAPGQNIEVKATVKIDNSKSATTQINVPQPIVTGITLTPDSPVIFRGDTQQMKATVEGIGYPSQEVIWSIRGQKKSNTTINQTGLLTIDRIEKATEDIEVKVISALDANKMAKTSVIVKERTIIEEIEEYPLPEEVNKDEIKNAINEILDTKRRYENLSKDDKLDMEYNIAEELNELVGMLDVVNIKVTNNIQSLIPNISAKNLAESLNLDDTMKLVQGSHTAGIELVVENIAENNVDQSEKELIENRVINKKIGMFIDISLYKTLTEVHNPSGVVQTKVEETTQPIKITLEIPEQFRNKKDYVIVRMHKGIVSVIDDVDSEANTITFYTNQFSTYALAYAEKDQSSQDTIIDKSVDTSDQTSFVVYQTLLLIGMLGIIGCMGYSFVNKKKRKKS